LEVDDSHYNDTRHYFKIPQVRELTKNDVFMIKGLIGGAYSINMLCGRNKKLSPTFPKEFDVMRSMHMKGILGSKQDIIEFFDKVQGGVGLVTQVVFKDENTKKRSAYVEFTDVDSMRLATKMRKRKVIEGKL
jgi:hypothetical protein